MSTEPTLTGEEFNRLEGLATCCSSTEFAFLGALMASYGPGGKTLLGQDLSALIAQARRSPLTTQGEGLKRQIEVLIEQHVEMNWTYKDDAYLTGIDEAADAILALVAGEGAAPLPEGGEGLGSGSSKPIGGENVPSEKGGA